MLLVLLILYRVKGSERMYGKKREREIYIYVVLKGKGQVERVPSHRFCFMTSRNTLSIVIGGRFMFSSPWLLI